MLTLSTVLHNRHNNFYAPVTPGERDQGQREQIINKERDTTAFILYSLKKRDRGHERTKDNSTSKNNNNCK